MEEGFHEASREVQMREAGLIPKGLDVGEDISLWIYLRR